MTAPAGVEQPRALRECDQCHVVDDLGHHQVVVPADGGLRMVSRHFACCADNGCPDGSCQTILNRSA
jgi:hypothetical protein